MENTRPSLDTHGTPPSESKEIFKKYQKMKLADIDRDVNILDFSRPEIPHDVEALKTIDPSQLGAIFQRFAPHDDDDNGHLTYKSSPVFHHRALPGLLLLPALLPSHVQRLLLARLLHRDLSDPRHKTNLHLHYNVPYPEMAEKTSSSVKLDQSTFDENLSFFSISPLSDLMIQPKDEAVHRPLSILRVLQRSLRWITLGGQYDWTNKVYPAEKPPRFPEDIGNLLEGIFPDMKPQAAIVNLYSPGDTLSLHRDVSEQCDKGLVSISLGCDCLFVIGDRHSSGALVIRLRSGDVVFMAGEARFAWHGVPRIIPNTCPSYLGSWPAERDQYEEWRDWMSNKRINLNVRQMYD